MSEKKISLEEIQKQQQLLQVQERQMLQQFLESKSPDDIIKAQDYIANVEKKKDTGIKSYVYSPDYFYDSLGYKANPTNITYQTLRNMARVPVIRSIIQTRQDQVADFGEPTDDYQRKGWAIIKKRKLFSEEKDKELTDSDKRRISDITDFLINGGIEDNTWCGDNFDTFLRKTIKDSLEVDQMTYEIVRNRRGMPIEFLATDGATYRLADSIDEDNKKDAIQINGYFPSYVQVYQGIVKSEFYPWELCFGIRNQSTNIYNNGYGVSELEDLIQIVTWLVNGMQYNGNFFKQGSNPKGFLNIKNNISDGNLSEFKQSWRSTIAGVQNAHRTPVFQGGEVEWIKLHENNKDMEFQLWEDFLIVLACSVYKIDPTEIGFTPEKSSSMFGQDGQKARLEHSKSKGLDPLLKFIQRKITKYIVSQLDPNFEFVFTGMEPEDEDKILEQDTKKVQFGGMSMEDFFKKHSKRDFDPKKDTILNNIYAQQRQMNLMGGEQSNAAVDEMTGDEKGNLYKENPYDEYEKSEENIFFKSFNDFCDKNLK